MIHVWNKTAPKIQISHYEKISNMYKVIHCLKSMHFYNCQLNKRTMQCAFIRMVMKCLLFLYFTYSHRLCTSILYLQRTGRMYEGTGITPPSGSSKSGRVCSPDFEIYSIMGKTNSRHNISF